MDEKSRTHDEAGTGPAPGAEPTTPKRWDPPTFERLRLEDAMTGSPNLAAFDGSLYYS